MVDASALVAIATNAPEAIDMTDEIRSHAVRLCCSVGYWEAARAIGRQRTVTASEAGRALDRLRADLNLTIVAVGEAEARRALDIQDRYGKGTGHPARLNMGDCFAYACAEINDARLLYKGNDFSRTDLA